MCIHVYMYACIPFIICSQFVHNLFTICSYGVHIYMLYCIMRGGEPALGRPVELIPPRVLKKIYYRGKKFNGMRKKLPEVEKIRLNNEKKNLSEFFFNMFMVAQVFDAKEPKSDVAIQYHCDLIILSDMLKQERYDQVKKIIDRASEKIACLETIMGLFDSWEDD